MHRHPRIRPAQLRACAGATFERLSVEPVTPELHAQVKASPIASPTIPSNSCPKSQRHCSTSSERHRLIMLTKGAIAEQSGKDRALGHEGSISPQSKSSPRRASRGLRARWCTNTICARGSHLDDRQQPKSDINPALAAGLHAVFVPHGDTWILEHEELNPAPSSQKLLIVGGFAEFREHF